MKNENKESIIVFQVENSKATFDLPGLPTPEFPRDFFPAWIVYSGDLDRAYGLTQVSECTSKNVEDGLLSEYSPQARSTSPGDRMMKIIGKDAYEVYHCGDYSFDMLERDSIGTRYSDVTACFTQWLSRETTMINTMKY